MLLFCWAGGPSRLARRAADESALAPAAVASDEMGGNEPPIGGGDDDWQDDLDDEDDDLDAFERRLLDAFEEEELEPDYDADDWDLPEEEEDEL